MSDSTDPQPGKAFKKNNGKWTFYVYPGGVRREADEYPDEESANRGSVTVLRIWEANNGKYGPLGVIS